LKKKPVFTVIPTNLSDKEVFYASQIQECLIKSRMKVIERPPIDFRVRELKGNIKGDEFDKKRFEGKTSSGMSRETDSFDIITTYSKSSADIIVQSETKHWIMKFIKNEKGYQILFLTKYKPGEGSSPSHLCDFIDQSLVSLGLIENQNNDEN